MSTTPGMRWRHVTISTKRSWNPGDERGWRSRRHKRHSSGDYTKRPPPHEHENLRKYFEERLGPAVVLPREVRSVIGQRLVACFHRKGYRILTVAVCRKHAHLLVELPDDILTIRMLVGQAKSLASRAVRKQLPGSIWGELGDFEPVDDHRHHINAFNYILYKQGRDAWTWSFRQGVPEEWLNW